MTTVVLFDIDGTLLLTGGAGRTAMEAALEATFGTRGPAGYRYDGKTDRLIVRESMRHAGVPDELIDARMALTLTRYLAGLTEALAQPERAARTLPGVPALVAAVDAAEDLVLGLLTGNVVEGAALKLGAAGLPHERFVVGAYGSDHEERPQLAPVAQARAVAHLGREVPGDRIVIIGDTPADLTCGRGIGARAVGVATGGYRRDELEGYGAYALVDDLSDTAALLGVIRGA